MPGKFEGNGDEVLAERLYELTMDSSQVDDLGEVDTFGWWCLIEDDEWHVCKEDSQGFWTIMFTGPEVRARDYWLGVEAEYEAWAEQEDDDAV